MNKTKCLFCGSEVDDEIIEREVECVGCEKMFTTKLHRHGFNWCFCPECVMEKEKKI